MIAPRRNRLRALVARAVTADTPGRCERALCASAAAGVPPGRPDAVSHSKYESPSAPIESANKSYGRFTNHPEPLLCVVNTRKGRGADRRLGGRARVVSTPSEVGERAYDTDEHHRYAQNIRAARELQVGCNSAGGTKIPVLLFAVKPIACTRALKGPGQAKLVYITHHTVNHTVGLNTLTVCLQASSVDLLVEFSTASSLIAHWLSCGWAVAPLGAG